MSERYMYRIIKLDGIERYKVQKFIREHRKWWGLRKVEAHWKDMVAVATYGGKSFTHDKLKDAERHVERLKRNDIIAQDKWVPVQSEL